MIGIFDSGLGGLTILKEMVRVVPQYDYMYLGDTARTPYGTRSPALIRTFTEQAVDFLYRHGCHLVIVACNTASSTALRSIQQKYLPQKFPKRNILGVLVPAAQDAVLHTENDRIGVIATDATVHSGAYEREIHKLNPNTKVSQKACPLLVPLIEAGEDNGMLLMLFLRHYLDPLLEEEIDTLILGCTHYGILEEKIQQIVGPSVHLVSGGKAVAPKLENYLSRNPEIEKDISQGGTLTFYTTDLTENFVRLGSSFFGSEITPRVVSLGT